ncbi:MAG: hypothetical protein Fur002_22710 [Anaerolineales bacterium]
MKKFFAPLFLCLTLAACAPSATLAPSVTALPSATATPTCTPTSSPTLTQIPSPKLTPVPLSVVYNQRLLSALPHADDSCLPAQTADDMGIYLYDLYAQQELLSINADVPFQFASAFKGPVLVYFLSQCKAYWDMESPEWQTYFLNQQEARNIPYYSSDEYRALLAAQLTDPQRWDNIEAFFAANRFAQNGAASAIDKRYFILSSVYSMTARSNNPAAGEVLNFVYEHCAPVTPPPNAPACYSRNAISQFNAWFNQFAGIEYAADEPQRGLFKWDTVIEKGENGQTVETKLPTFGIEDACVSQWARLSCSADVGSNAWTARDFFRFYKALAEANDARLKNAALALLGVDAPGAARGNLKNLARRMGAAAFSKNGHAYFIHGSINTDAGILLYKNKAFIVVALGYDAQPSLSLLYGDYSPSGEPLAEQSLLRDLLDEYAR